MEKVDLHSYTEFFNSNDAEQSDALMVYSLSDLLGSDLVDYEGFEADDYDDNHSSGSDSGDDIIDVEAIDELQGIMSSPKKSQQTFTSARVVPSPPFNTLNKQVAAVKPSQPQQTSNLIIPPTTGRKRLSSEQIVSDLVSLHESNSNLMLSSKVIDEDEVIEATIDSLDNSMITEHLEQENFSLLGIEGIEADDLESLINQFEGATGAEADTDIISQHVVTQPAVLQSPIKAPAQLVNEETTPVPSTSTKPRSLSLEDYRKIRARRQSNYSTPSSPSTPRPNTTPYQSVAEDQTAEPPVAVVTEVAAHCELIGLDHDYCGKTSDESSLRPAEEASSQRNTMTVEETQDIKKEILTLLNKIPQYFASCGQPLSESAAPTTNNSAPSSVSSPLHTSSNNDEKESRKERTKPRAYMNHGRSRQRKRKYRKRHWSSSAESDGSAVSSSRSSSRSSSSSSDSSHSDDSRCSCDEESRSNSRRRRSDSHISSSSRKSRSKHTYSKRARYSSHSRSHRGSRHKRKSSPMISSSRSSTSRRRQHKSGRSSQSVSPYSTSSSDRSRSPSPCSSEREMERKKKEAEEAHKKAMTERRVVYVGGIGNRYTRSDLRKRFGGFGEIERVTIHQRDNGENYGFVTFFSKADAYAAVEKGNDVYGPKFNLGFGGRRKFCDTEYADLDGCQAVKEEWATSTRSKKGVDDDFDTLLKNTMKKFQS